MNVPTWALTSRKNEQRGEVLAGMLGILDKPASIESVNYPQFLRFEKVTIAGKLQIQSITTSVSTYMIEDQDHWDELTSGKKVYFYEQPDEHHVRMFIE